MLYVVDGHNLIGKMPGMSLAALDDEEDLLKLLQPFVRAKPGRKMEVFFDKAPPGYAGTRMYGTIRATFVPSGMIADDAIAAFLKNLGRSAKNGVTVVSSDHKVQNSAREARAKVLLSEDFAEQVLAARDGAGSKPGPAGQKSGPAAASRTAARSALSEAGLSDREVDAWLKEFHIDPSQADKPIEPPPTQTKVKPVNPAQKPKKSRPQSRPPQSRPPQSRPHHGFPKKE